MARALKLEAAGVEAHPIATDSFEGLMSGHFTVVHGAFATRAEAEALVEALRARRNQGLREGVGAAAARRPPGRDPRNRRAERNARGPGRCSSPPTTAAKETVKAAANGQFVMWMAASGKLDIQNEAETPDKHNMRASAGVCIELPSISGRVDVGTLDTTTWLCDNRVSDQEQRIRRRRPAPASTWDAPC